MAHGEIRALHWSTQAKQGKDDMKETIFAVLVIVLVAWGTAIFGARVFEIAMMIFVLLLGVSVFASLFSSNNK